LRRPKSKQGIVVRARRTVLGRKAVLAARPTDQPMTPAPRGGLRPSVACRDRERRRLALRELSGFRAAYRGALALWIAGEREAAVFPPGTYKLRLLGALVAA
jgi:hypothetical protein